MPKLTGLIHTYNDARRIGRALESLRPCDELLIVDNGSSDATIITAREYGAVIKSVSKMPPGNAAAKLAANDWVLCLLASEIISEGLEASLQEWKISEQEPGTQFAVQVQTDRMVSETSQRSTRLVHRTYKLWEKYLPGDDPQSRLLDGFLLRIHDI